MMLFDYKDHKIVIEIDGMTILCTDYENSSDAFIKFTTSFCDYQDKEVTIKNCHFVGIVGPMFYLKLAIKSAKWHFLQWYEMKKAYAKELFRKVM